MEKTISNIQSECEDNSIQCQKLEESLRKARVELRKRDHELHHAKELLFMEQEKNKNYESRIEMLKNENESLVKTNKASIDDSRDFFKLNEKIKKLEKLNKQLSENLMAEKLFNKSLEKDRVNIQRKNMLEMQSKYENLLRENARVNSERKPLLLKVTRIEEENDSLRLSLEERIQNEESTGSSECNFSILETERKIRDDLREELKKQEDKFINIKNELDALQESFDNEIRERDIIINDLKDHTTAKIGMSEFLSMKKELKIIQKSLGSTLNIYKNIFYEKKKIMRS